MAIEILSTVPISGTLPEKAFGNGANHLWVKFDDDVLDPWVGAFACGDHVGSYAAQSRSGAWAFVLARGLGYFVDPSARSLLGTTDIDYLVQALYVPAADAIVACTFTDLLLYTPSGRLWSSGSITYDGIDLGEVRGATVHGGVWSLEAEGMVPFELDVARREYRSTYRFIE